jgi:hypothetical protein
MEMPATSAWTQRSGTPQQNMGNLQMIGQTGAGV